MVAPSANCHLRGWSASSERPQPERSTVLVEVLCSSTQSLPSPSVSTVRETPESTSEMTTPVAFACVNSRAMAAADSVVLARPGVGAMEAV